MYCKHFPRFFFPFMNERKVYVARTQCSFSAWSKLVSANLLLCSDQPVVNFEQCRCCMVLIMRVIKNRLSLWVHTYRQMKWVLFQLLLYRNMCASADIDVESLAVHMSSPTQEPPSSFNPLSCHFIFTLKPGKEYTAFAPCISFPLSLISHCFLPEHCVFVSTV